MKTFTITNTLILLQYNFWWSPPPPPNLASKVIKNTISDYKTGTWGFLYVTVTGLILLLLQPNAVTPITAVTSLGVTVNV